MGSTTCKMTNAIDSLKQEREPRQAALRYILDAWEEAIHEEAERFFGRLPNLARRRASRLTKLAPMPAEEASQRYLARFRALV